MSLKLPSPPAATVRVVRAALDSPTARHGSRIPGLRARGAVLTVDQPLELHRLDLSPRPGAAAPADLRRLSRPVGWRFTVHSADLPDPVAAAETMNTPDGPAFRHFCSGPFVAAALRAVHQARVLPELRGALFEPRLLSVPDLYMMGLWLHRPDGGGAEDLLVPLAPAPPGFIAHRPHRVGDLLPVLAGRAALRMLAETA